jgi:hypothetical protein
MINSAWILLTSAIFELAGDMSFTRVEKRTIARNYMPSEFWTNLTAIRKP